MHTRSGMSKILNYKTIIMVKWTDKQADRQTDRQTDGGRTGAVHAVAWKNLPKLPHKLTNVLQFLWDLSLKGPGIPKSCVDLPLQ